jgi:hypothetical protein
MEQRLVGRERLRHVGIGMTTQMALARNSAVCGWPLTLTRREGDFPLMFAAVFPACGVVARVCVSVLQTETAGRWSAPGDVALILALFVVFGVGSAGQTEPDLRWASPTLTIASLVSALCVGIASRGENVVWWPAYEQGRGGACRRQGSGVMCSW